MKFHIQIWMIEENAFKLEFFPSIYQTKLEAGNPVLPLKPRRPPPGPNLNKLYKYLSKQLQIRFFFSQRVLRINNYFIHFYHEIEESCINVFFLFAVTCLLIKTKTSLSM